MKLAQAVIPAVAAVLAVGVSAAPAMAEPTQPANLGNVENAVRGGTVGEPHCHLVLAAGNNASRFDAIITGAAHQGHEQTGLPTGVFKATACP